MSCMHCRAVPTYCTLRVLLPWNSHINFAKAFSLNLFWTVTVNHYPTSAAAAGEWRKRALLLLPLSSIFFSTATVDRFKAIESSTLIHLQLQGSLSPTLILTSVHSSLEKSKPECIKTTKLDKFLTISETLSSFSASQGGYSLEVKRNAGREEKQKQKKQKTSFWMFSNAELTSLLVMHNCRLNGSFKGAKVTSSSYSIVARGATNDGSFTWSMFKLLLHLLCLWRLCRSSSSSPAERWPRGPSPPAFAEQIQQKFQKPAGGRPEKRMPTAASDQLHLRHLSFSLSASWSVLGGVCERVAPLSKQ